MIKPLEIALSQFGIGGFDGAKHNKNVVQYFADIGHSWVKDDETAWCAAFANWCLLKAGLKQTGSLAARSFLKYGTATDKPVLGDVVVLWRIKPTSSYGHVGFFIKKTSTHVYLLGGNQTNLVKISAFPVDRVLGYRRIPSE